MELMVFKSHFELRYSHSRGEDDGFFHASWRVLSASNATDLQDLFEASITSQLPSRYIRYIS
jgi:hypothetical protein